MDAISGNTVVHENKHRGHTVYALNRPTVVQGWIGNGIGLNGVNQYISAGANTSCNGNLATCRQGFTLRSRVRPKNLVDNMYLYSSSQYDIYYKDGKIWAEFRTPDGIWRVSSNEFKDLDWNLMEWTWHPVHGLIMYVNNREVARSTIKMPNRGIYDYNKVFYIGRANTDMNYEKYGQFVVDDVQLWESYRQFLIDEGLINPTTDPKPPVGGKLISPWTPFIMLVSNLACSRHVTRHTSHVMMHTIIHHACATRISHLPAFHVLYHGIWLIYFCRDG